MIADGGFKFGSSTWLSGLSVYTFTKMRTENVRVSGTGNILSLSKGNKGEKTMIEGVEYDRY